MSFKRRPLEERLGPQTPNPSPLSQSRNPVSRHGRVYLRLAEVARAKGVLNRRGTPNRAAIRRMCSMSDETLFYLLRYPELTERIHFSTLAKLCYGLGVSPGDLLEYVPTDGGETPLSEQYKARPDLGLDQEAD
jgi:DNA-binding Xre family transcriptional regulator